MVRGLSSAAVAVLAFALVGTAAAATDAERVIGRKTTSGDFPAATASGSVNRPLLVRVQVASTPTQPAQVTWRLRCVKGRAAKTRLGQFRAATPETRRILFPMVKPDRCTLTASAQLEQQGTLTVTLLAR